MQIDIFREDLSLYDSGGGMRFVHSEITIDNSLPIERQRRALAYELLASYFENFVGHDLLEDIADRLCDELEALGD